MDGSYGHPAKHSQYPTSLQPQSTNNYQVNVRRNKTRKWVEAKTQNYDGDDWGGDDLEEEEAESEPESAQTQARPPLHHASSSSSQRVQLAKSSRSTPSPTRGLSDLPSLRLQAQQSSTRASSPAGSVAAAAKPSASHSSTSSLGARHALGQSQEFQQNKLEKPPRTTSFEQSWRPDPQPTPDDGAKLSEDDDGPGHSVDDTRAVSKRPSWERNDGSLHSRHSSRPISQSFLPDNRDASHDAGGFERKSSVGPHSLEHKASSSSRGHGMDHPVASFFDEPRRSPTLVIQDYEAAGRVDANDSSQREPQQHVEADEEEFANASGGAPLTVHAHDQAALYSAPFPSIPPLRTPSPHGLQKATTPTEPLWPQRGGESPVAVASSLRRETTFPTAESSPLKESDVLTDEIMRTLGPRRATSSDLLSSTNDEGHVGHGGYSVGDHHKYSSATTNEPQNRFRAEPFAAEASDGPQTAPVPSRTPTSFDGDGSPQKSPSKSQARRRFSWEAHEEEEEEEDASASQGNQDSHAAEEQAEASPGTLDCDSGVQDPLPGTMDVGLRQIPQSQEPLMVHQTPSPISSLPAERESLDQQYSGALATPIPPSEVTAAPPSATAPFPGQTVATTAMKEKAMAFKDILALGSTTDRITKFNEARQTLASQESGLGHWLSTFGVQHAESGQTVYSAGAQTTVQGGGGGGGGGLTNQQAYYQQHQSTSSMGRSRLGGLSMPSQMSGSSFGHSVPQIGTKGKELMHSAGKMGKGLLSKGKSKLRGSGDKVDPPAVQPNPSKGERRRQWRLSLGPDLREGSLVPHANEPNEHERNEHERNEHEGSLPRLSAQSPVSPFDVDELGWASEFRDAVSKDGQVRQRERGDEEGKQRDPYNEAHDLDAAAANHKSTSETGETCQENMSRLTHTRLKAKTADEPRLDDWVVIPPHQSGSDQGQAQTAPLAAGLRSVEKAPPLHAAPEDSGIGLQSLASHPSPDGSQLPQRVSSFVGLPPIRRGSIFGFTSGAPTKAAAADGVDETEEEAAAALTTLPSKSRAQEAEGEEAGVAVLPKDNNGDGKLAAAVMGEELRENHVQARRPDRQLIESRVLPYLQSLPSTVKPRTNPLPRLPPAGPWKLEESHLSEPLHPVVRKRSGTDFAQQVMYHGYSKELGLEIPAAPVSPSQPVLSRLRSDVPPSSAQRYPELFAPRPSASRQQVQVQSQPSRDGPTRGEVGGRSSEERGRRSRGSGVLKELGNRIVRATSRERRSSTGDSRPPTASNQGEELTTTTTTTTSGLEPPERRKKRSSFLGLVGRRSSGDHTESQGAMPPGSHGEQKRSVVGAAPAGGASSSGMPRPPTAGDEQRRGSSGIAGLFSRARLEQGGAGDPAGLDPTRLVNGDGRPRARAGTMGAFAAAQQNAEQNARSEGSLFGRRLSSRSRDRPRLLIQTQQPQQLPTPKFEPLVQTSTNYAPKDASIQPVLLNPPDVNGRLDRGPPRPSTSAQTLLEGGPESAMAAPHINNLSFEKKKQPEVFQKEAIQDGMAAQDAMEEIWRPLTVTPDISMPSSTNQEPRIAAEPSDGRNGDDAESKPTADASASNVSSVSSSQPRFPNALPLGQPETGGSVCLEESKRQRQVQMQESAKASPQMAQSIISRASSVLLIQQPPPLTGERDDAISPASRVMDQDDDVNDEGRQQQTCPHGGPRDTIQQQGQKPLTVSLPGKYQPAPAPVSKQIVVTQAVPKGPARPDILEVLAAAPREDEETQGSRWKGLRSRMAERAQVSQQQQDQTRAGKGSDKAKGKKLLGALRRSAKQAEPLNAQYVHSQQGTPRVQGHATPASSRQRVIPRLVEPQYEPVPIPRGYSAVHGGGWTDMTSLHQALPYAYQYVPSPVQGAPWQQQQQQQHQQALPRRQETLRSQSTGLSSEQPSRRVSGVSLVSLSVSGQVETARAMMSVPAQARSPVTPASNFGLSASVVPQVQSGSPVELEDTEEARKRAIRLASQEEKIVIDPEDYEAKMTATSYPGQEWNPFEVVDWEE